MGWHTAASAQENVIHDHDAERLRKSRFRFFELNKCLRYMVQRAMVKFDIGSKFCLS